MNQTNPSVDAFMRDADQWKNEYTLLRQIALNSELTEELKWGVPCYTLNGKNVLIIHGFKEYCALLFIKGALMQDPQGILIQQTENVQAGRHVRFTNVNQIIEQTDLLKGYLQEAIRVERSGLKVTMKPVSEQNIPEEFANAMAKTPALQAAFDALTPGRKRAYLLYFSAPKQAKTREERIAKSVPAILQGIGLNEH